MKTWLRWVVVALLCALCGFGGSIAGVYLMPGHFRGEPGVAGPPGPRGPAGPTGPMGTEDPTTKHELLMMATDVANLNRRLSALESSSQGVGTGTNCDFPIQAVTEVSLVTYGPAAPYLDTQTQSVCPYLQ